MLGTFSTKKKAMKKRVNSIALFRRHTIYLCFFLAIFLVGCGPSGDKKGKGRIFVAQDVAAVVSLDPAEVYETVGVEILFNVYRHLFSSSGDSVEKDLVESYEFLKGGRVLRIKLCKNQYFASGNPVTAGDVVYSLHRVVFLQKKASYMLSNLGFTPDNVKKLVRYVDEYTVEIALPKKLNERLILCCLASSATAIVDSELLKKHTEDDDYGHKWLRTSYAGGGPLVLAVWQPNEAVILKKNQWYVGQHDVSFTALIVRHVPDPETRMAMLERGEVDIIRGIPAEYVSALDTSRYAIVRCGSEVEYLNLNQKNEYLRNPKVQKAIRLLINFPGLIKAFGEELTDPLHTLIPRGFEGYIEGLILPTYDPEQARALIHEEYGKDIELELDITKLSVGRALQAAFAPGGISIKLNYYDNQQVIERLQARKHTLSLKSFAPDFADSSTFFTIFIADPGVVAWRNSISTEGLREKIRRITRASKQERLRLYREVQERFFEKPIIMVAQTYGVAIINKKKIQNLQTGTNRGLVVQYYTLKRAL